MIHPPVAFIANPLPSTAERSCELARRATKLDGELERLLESKGQLASAAPRVSSESPSRAVLRTARVERLRESMKTGDASRSFDSATLWRQAEALRWELALSAWDLAKRETRRIRILELTPDDLAGEAALGLYEAAKRFDPDLGFHFSTYAKWWIRAQTKGALNRSHGVVRLPDNARRQRGRLLRAESALRVTGSTVPGLAILSDVLNLTKRRVRDLSPSFTSVSWDHVPAEGGHSLAEITCDPTLQSIDQTLVERQDRSIVVDELLGGIDGIHQKVVWARFGLGGGAPQTLDVLSKSLGLSRERVRQLERQALDVLKEGVDRANAPTYTAFRKLPSRAAHWGWMPKVPPTRPGGAAAAANCGRMATAA